MDPNQKLQLLSFSIIIKRKVKYALLPLSYLLLLLASIIFLSLINPNLLLTSTLDIESLLQNLNNNQTPLLLPSSCDYTNGRWVWDQNYSLGVRSYTENCPFLDPGFRCTQNGRKEEDYRKWRWQPYDCHIPRFNARDFLERSRNGRIVFAGDSIGRNQWESLVCMLAQGVRKQSAIYIYEEHGKPISKHKGYLSMRFHEYNLSVEYYRSPFLVVNGRPPANSAEEVRCSIRVDQMHWFSRKWVDADVLVFGAGHWWNEAKTTNMGCYFQEKGIVNMSMNVMEAFWRSLQTWKSWATHNLDPKRSHIFFRSYSPAHFRNGIWKSRGHCDMNTEPETNCTKLNAEPLNNLYITNVIKEMQYGNMKVHYLNITHLTEFRKDAHPSKYREPGTPPNAPQDCSHWCLPGVPDTWNELLYAHLLSIGFRIN